METLAPNRPLGPLSEADLHYIRRNFLHLSELCWLHGLEPDAATRAILDRRLPRPSYALEDGSPMFPRDAFALLECAGSIEALPAHFQRRYRTIVESHGELDSGKGRAEWDGYLSGEYGVCLRQVTPETIFLKERLVILLDRQLQEPRPEDPSWRALLAGRIDALDALERPFAPCDRFRFHGPVSRDRLIDGPRRKYSWLG